MLHHGTHEEDGPDVTSTTPVPGLDFSGFLAAYLSNPRGFGPLASVVALVAFLVDGIVAPALIVLVSKTRAPAHSPVPAP